MTLEMYRGRGIGEDGCEDGEDSNEEEKGCLHVEPTARVALR